MTVPIGIEKLAPLDQLIKVYLGIALAIQIRISKQEKVLPFQAEAARSFTETIQFNPNLRPEPHEALPQCAEMCPEDVYHRTRMKLAEAGADAVRSEYLQNLAFFLILSQRLGWNSGEYVRKRFKKLFLDEICTGERRIGKLLAFADELGILQAGSAS